MATPWTGSEKPKLGLSSSFMMCQGRIQLFIIMGIFTNQGSRGQIERGNKKGSKGSPV
jgi:hypothetical protein